MIVPVYRCHGRLAKFLTEPYPGAVEGIQATGVAFWHAGDPAVDKELRRFRAEKDQVFRADPHSPLTLEQRKSFSGLPYFDENPDLVVHATIDRQVDPDEVVMATSSGDEQRYRRYGVVRFDVDGEPAQVTLYSSEDSDELFVPFRDATSGKESYGAGRYLEVHSHGDRVTIDFNYAYNPNCAYDPSWSCPLPPRENWLKVPITAGEKAFSADHSS